LKIEEEFLKSKVTDKLKSFEGLPLAYNPNHLPNHVKEVK